MAHSAAPTTQPWTRDLQGPSGQLFGDPRPGPDETAFQGRQHQRRLLQLALLQAAPERGTRDPGGPAEQAAGEKVGEAPRTWKDYTLLVGPTPAYGYLTGTADMSKPGAPTLTFDFTAPGSPSAADSVTIELS